MISLQDIAAERGLDEADLVEFITEFVDYSEQEDLKGLQEAIIAADAPTVRSRAHSIKGAALNLGLSEIASIAETLEGKGAEGSLDGIQTMVDELTVKIRDLGKFLHEMS